MNNPPSNSKQNHFPQSRLDPSGMWMSMNENSKSDEESSSSNRSSNEVGMVASKHPDQNIFNVDMESPNRFPIKRDTLTKRTKISIERAISLKKQQTVSNNLLDKDSQNAEPTQKRKSPQKSTFSKKLGEKGLINTEPIKRKIYPHKGKTSIQHLLDKKTESSKNKITVSKYLLDREIHKSGPTKKTTVEVISNPPPAVKKLNPNNEMKHGLKSSLKGEKNQMSLSVATFDILPKKTGIQEPFRLSTVVNEQPNKDVSSKRLLKNQEPNPARESEPLHKDLKETIRLSKGKNVNIVNRTISQSSRQDWKETAKQEPLYKVKDFNSRQHTIFKAGRKDFKETGRQEPFSNVKNLNWRFHTIEASGSYAVGKSILGRYIFKERSKKPSNSSLKSIKLSKLNKKANMILLPSRAEDTRETLKKNSKSSNSSKSINLSMIGNTSMISFKSSCLELKEKVEQPSRCYLGSTNTSMLVNTSLDPSTTGYCVFKEPGALNSQQTNSHESINLSMLGNTSLAPSRAGYNVLRERRKEKEPSFSLESLDLGMLGNTSLLSPSRTNLIRAFRKLFSRDNFDNEEASPLFKANFNLPSCSKSVETDSSDYTFCYEDFSSSNFNVPGANVEKLRKYGIKIPRPGWDPIKQVTVLRNCLNTKRIRRKKTPVKSDILDISQQPERIKKVENILEVENEPPTNSTNLNSFSSNKTTELFTNSNTSFHTVNERKEEKNVTQSHGKSHPSTSQQEKRKSKRSGELINNNLHKIKELNNPSKLRRSTVKQKFLLPSWLQEKSNPLGRQSSSTFNQQDLQYIEALGAYYDHREIQGQTALAPYGFYLGKIVGQGAYSIVRAAVSEKHNLQKVAVKIIGKFQAPADMINTFLAREIKVIKNVRHKYIIKFLSAIESTHRVYLVMELAEGGTLLNYIRINGRVNESKAKKWFYQLSSAVLYCHQKGIVHRDIKCENILFSLTGVLKLSDFGFARMVETTFTKEFTSQTYCGSYAYASPEILQLVGYKPHLADIWSMGVVLWAMVFGTLPFDSSSFTKLIKQVLTPVIFPEKPSTSKNLQNLFHSIFVTEETRVNAQGLIKDNWFNKVNQVKYKNQHQSKARQSIPIHKKPPTKKTNGKSRPIPIQSRLPSHYIEIRSKKPLPRKEGSLKKTKSNTLESFNKLWESVMNELKQEKNGKGQRRGTTTNIAIQPKIPKQPKRQRRQKPTSIVNKDKKTKPGVKKISKMENDEPQHEEEESKSGIAASQSDSPILEDIMLTQDQIKTGPRKKVKKTKLSDKSVSRKITFKKSRPAPSVTHQKNTANLSEWKKIQKGNSPNMAKLRAENKFLAILPFPQTTAPRGTIIIRDETISNNINAPSTSGLRNDHESQNQVTRHREI